ncbi:MAG TPA: hypothetical protein VFT65_16540 [Candidatus Angelobacter sp.]|nr:hypothetical protein [Candidatus Angelobacter sp.]
MEADDASTTGGVGLFSVFAAGAGSGTDAGTTTGAIAAAEEMVLPQRVQKRAPESSRAPQPAQTPDSRGGVAGTDGAGVSMETAFELLSDGAMGAILAGGGGGSASALFPGSAVDTGGTAPATGIFAPQLVQKVDEAATAAPQAVQTLVEATTGGDAGAPAGRARPQEVQNLDASLTTLPHDGQTAILRSWGWNAPWSHDIDPLR